MIKIYEQITDKELSMHFMGHADSAAHGEDLVCCAVSTLFYTIVAAATEQGYEVQYEAKSGNSIVRVHGITPGKYLDPLLVGLNMLEGKYPQYIKILRKE